MNTTSLPSPEKILAKWYTPLHTNELARLQIVEAMKEFHEQMLEHSREEMAKRANEYMIEMLKKKEMTQQALLEAFEYLDGVLIHRMSKGCRRPGQVAGSLHPGMGPVVGFGGRPRKLREVIWIMHNGAISENYEVVLIEDDLLDHRIENLSLKLKAKK
jgi:hypothetical protein